MTDHSPDHAERASLWDDEIERYVAIGFEAVSRNPSDHETVVAYRTAIAAALRGREAVVEAAQAMSDFIGDKDIRVYATDLVVRDLRAALHDAAHLQQNGEL